LNLFYKITADVERLQTELINARKDTENNQEASINNIIDTIKREIRESEEGSKEYRDNLPKNIQLLQTRHDRV